MVLSDLLHILCNDFAGETRHFGVEVKPVSLSVDKYSVGVVCTRAVSDLHAPLSCYFSYINYIVLLVQQKYSSIIQFIIKRIKVKLKITMFSKFICVKT